MNRRRLLLTGLATLGASTLSPVAAQAAKAQQGLFVHAEPRPLPALDIRDNEGRPAGLDGFRGRPVLMNLWASWCLPCVAELPALDRLKPQIEPEGVAVMALCLDRSGAVGAVNTYARLGIGNLAVHVDYERKAGEVLGVPVLPTTLLVDAAGREVARFVGPAAWDGAEAMTLLRALKAGKPLDPSMAPPLAKPKTNP
ncbi:TlpA family protein disulfide reductase [Magnetospirillum aberrantis]|uniref:TlpA family protein disulfide reductase n=1 Tax=Magnetospirillum aberrantis SpK TaxID=908842 RepID=A0A7C9QRT6_9PROT|nr:TlpA disulfide reductase family protein [Magnetospirillum aberrantis]NFV78601.1 TlpA family protein disulfide reductase [Magnetospirillum aberrantis SpK]